MSLQENFGVLQTEENEVRRHCPENPGSIFTNSQLANFPATPKAIQEKRELDFDKFLPYVGEFGIYQKMLFLMMVPFGFFLAWVYFTQIFITLVPQEHWCRVPELENLTVAERYTIFLKTTLLKSSFPLVYFRVFLV